MSDSHNERAHARLSPSGANRWINCPASPSIEELFPDEESEAAAEGTLAHEFAEIEQNKYLERIDSLTYNTRLAELRSHTLYNDGMEDYVAEYVEYVLAFYYDGKAQKVSPIEIYVEEKLDLSMYIPDGFGSSDNIILIGRTLHVFDLKFGYLPVSAIENKQLRIYAIGAYELLKTKGHEIDNVFMHIVQPRINNFSTDEILIDELTHWAETDLRMFAERADRGEGGQHSGEHCQFCKAAHSCGVLAHDSTAELENLKQESDYNLLTIEEKSALFLKMPLYSLWASAFTDHMTATAKNGVKYDGLKLVEGTTRRTFSSDAAVLDKLTNEIGIDKELLVEEKLISLGKLEKFLGKKELTATLGAFIFKPRGKVILTSESDKRPAYSNNTPEDDFGEPLDPEDEFE